MSMSTITVSILQTGTVRIRPTHQTQSAKLPVPLRRARVLTDRRWTAPLPINTYLIGHPEGPILFDTGESPRATHGLGGYFPWWQPFFHVAVDIDVPKDQSIGALLAQRGLGPADLRSVVVSHLHHDHGDGLPDLVGATVYVSREHWKAFRHYIPATMEGAVPKQWPNSFKPTILEPSGPAIGPFDRSYPLTSDGRVVAVDTPGHVPGHLSVIVFADDVTYFLLGDATYDQALLDAEKTDGVNKNPRLAIESLHKIKEFASDHPTVMLPAHDLNAAIRLVNREIYTPTS
jgi:glyoxylase-like metal-dependent hydrolase (beta-lactamase superfamily II)